MKRAEWAKRYGVHVCAVKKIGNTHLEAMNEDARALLLGMSLRPGPSRAAVRRAMTRIAREDAIARRALRRQLRMKPFVDKLAQEIWLRMSGKVHDLVVIRPVKKRVREDPRARRLMELAVKARVV